MNKKIELTGQRFGSLIVIACMPWVEGKKTRWVCRCDCGRKLIVRSDNLRKGRTKQCSVCHGAGCLSNFIMDGGDKIDD